MPEQATVIYQLLNNKAKAPCKPKSLFDAGWDVFTTDSGIIIPPHGDVLLHTGLRVQIPVGYCIQVNPRSGKAVKNKITIGARVIDSPYRGELMIHIINNSADTPYEISEHDPVAQLLVLPCASLMVEGTIDDITERGSAGFGSTDRVLQASSRKSPAPEALIDPQAIKAKLQDISDGFAYERFTKDEAKYLIFLLSNHCG